VQINPIAPDVTPAERATFVGGRCAIEALPPTTLYRLLGRSCVGAWNTAFGQKCWFDESTFFDCVCDAREQQLQPARSLASLKFLLRDRLAVAANWNDFSAFVALRIPADSDVLAAVGPAAAQPYMVDGRSPGKQLGPLMLSGGAKQYIIRVEKRIAGYLRGPQSLVVARA
jgi:hypothetical protein